MSYQSDTQKIRTTKVKEHSSIVDEKLLAERVYYGDQTHVYVGYLRAFKSGYFEGTKIRKITVLLCAKAPTANTEIGRAHV